MEASVAAQAVVPPKRGRGRPRSEIPCVGVKISQTAQRRLNRLAAKRTLKDGRRYTLREVLDDLLNDLGLDLDGDSNG